MLQPMDSGRSKAALGGMLAGRYQLVAEAAKGGMGDVYEALDREDGRRVAVKLLRAEYLADDSMRRRFRREGAILKALDHPSIVKLLELGIADDGAAYIVTEFVQGSTLRERISGGPLGARELDPVVLALTDALETAHAHGVIHGDLKPDNVILVSLAGELSPRLIDFGASKVLGLDRLTATGEIAGTPAYMAPECLTGGDDLDERVDVYGLGVVLYESLSGFQPFADGHVGRAVQKIVVGDCLPVDTVADVSSPISAVVQRAMHHDKTARYRNVAELVDAWTKALRSETP